MVRKLGFLILFLAGAGAAHAAPGFVAGDSLGVGVGWASGLPSRAKLSVSIRNSAVPIEQISQAEPGSVVFMSLGTNDAVCQSPIAAACRSSIDGLGANIDRIVGAAAQAKVHLVWIGPPCVFKPWDQNAKALDAILQQKLKGTDATYVSMRDDTICSPALRAAEGVHFTMAGYHRMWEKAQGAAAAAGYTVVAGAPTGPGAGGGIRTAALHKARGGKRIVRHRARHHHAVVAAAWQPAVAAPAPAPAPKSQSLLGVLFHDVSH